MSNTTKALITIGSYVITDITVDGTVDEAVAAYRELDTKDKAKARKSTNDYMMTCVMAGDLAGAQFAKALGDSLTSAKPAAEAVDPTQVLIDAVAELELAAWMIKVGHRTPDGLDVSGVNVDEIEWITADKIADGFRDIVGDVRYASIEAGAEVYASNKRTRSSDRIDIGQAILSAFDGLESGEFLTVSEISKRGNAGTGPIMARLFPVYRDKKTGTVESRECTVDGVTPGVGGKNNVKGAYKD